MLKLALLPLALVVAVGCSYDPCASREARAAWVGAGGPVGLVAALALNCERPEPMPEPIAEVPASGLVEQTEQPDMGAPADMAQAAPDLAPGCDLPDLWYTDWLGRKICGHDMDLDGIPDALDKCKATSAGATPDPSRKGCPAPGYYDVSGKVLNAESGSWSLLNNVWTSGPIIDWKIFRPLPSVLVMRVLMAQTDPADQTLTEFSWSGTVDMGRPTTQPECAVLKYYNGLMDFVSNPSDLSTKMCEGRTFRAEVFDEAGISLVGGAECPLQAGSQIVNCKMAFGQIIPLRSGAQAFLVKFFATGAVSVSNIQISGKVQVSLH